MNKLINEVKKEIANRAVELEKAKIKQMLKLIKSKEQDLKVIKEEITTLKEQLEKGDYSVVSHWHWHTSSISSADSITSPHKIVINRVVW